MHKGFIVNGLLVMLLALVIAPAQAKLEHVSINSRQFELGQYPQLKVNMVGDKNAVASLAFYVEQGRGAKAVQEKLMVQPINHYLLMLTGTENVTDKTAQLVVKKYHRNTWHTVIKLPVFDAPQSDNSAQLVQSQAMVQSLANVKAQAAQNAASSVTALVDSNHRAKQAPSTQVAAPAPQAAKTEAQTAPSSEPIASSREAANPKAICTLPYTHGDSLWRIASHYAPSWQVNVYGAMLAIYNTNPKAFAGGDIQGLMQGARLICPTGRELSQYRDRAVDILKFEIQLAKAQLKRQEKTKMKANEASKTAQ